MSVPMPEMAVFGARGTHEDVTQVVEPVGVDSDRVDPQDDEEERDRG